MTKLIVGQKPPGWPRLEPPPLDPNDAADVARVLEALRSPLDRIAVVVKCKHCKAAVGDLRVHGTARIYLGSRRDPAAERLLTIARSSSEFEDRPRLPGERWPRADLQGQYLTALESHRGRKLPAWCPRDLELEVAPAELVGKATRHGDPGILRVVPLAPQR